MNYLLFLSVFVAGFMHTALAAPVPVEDSIIKGDTLATYAIVRGSTVTSTAL